MSTNQSIVPRRSMSTSLDPSPNLQRGRQKGPSPAQMLTQVDFMVRALVHLVRLEAVPWTMDEISHLFVRRTAKLRR